MKALFVFGCIGLLSTATFANITNKSTQQQQVGYSFGYLMGKSSADTLKNIDLNAFISGIQAAAKGQPSALTDEEMAKVLTEYKRQSDAKELKALQMKAADNLKKGTAFLAENAKKPEVKTTKSGLQYQVLKQGTGAKPKATSTVKVHYEGRLLDGTVFDSSIARQQPVSFPLSQVIQGWTEGLQLMNKGSQFRLFIPSSLAYGEIGSGDAIEPNSTLIFDIELLDINSK
ncbi:FKBP-type peptidyl-prolyl cis-trans isomerase [Acinetobacter sp. P1(2025)]|uniref:FKBP-type peptidyl-prolyl cis-trans isomerase n=1 Tax=Acinetobacter sp. P1(2025) TaxID=3446120 RepID=UPI003F533B2E